MIEKFKGYCSSVTWVLLELLLLLLLIHSWLLGLSHHRLLHAHHRLLLLHSHHRLLHHWLLHTHHRLLHSHHRLLHHWLLHPHHWLLWHSTHHRLLLHHRLSHHWLLHRCLAHHIHLTRLLLICILGCIGIIVCIIDISLIVNTCCGHSCLDLSHAHSLRRHS